MLFENIYLDFWSLVFEIVLSFCFVQHFNDIQFVISGDS